MDYLFQTPVIYTIAEFLKCDIAPLLSTCKRAVAYRSHTYVKALFYKKPWVTACNTGDIDLLKYFHSNDISFEGNGKKLLDIASKRGHLNIVEFLHNNEISHYSGDAVTNAVVYGHADIVKFLITNGHMISTDTDQLCASMCWAARYGYLDVLEYLYSIGWKCDNTILDEAAGAGKLEVVKFLLVQKHEITRTSLLMAERYNQAEVSEFLHSFMGSIIIRRKDGHGSNKISSSKSRRSSKSSHKSHKNHKSHKSSKSSKKDKKIETDSCINISSTFRENKDTSNPHS